MNENKTILGPEGRCVSLTGARRSVSLTLIKHCRNELGYGVRKNQRWILEFRMGYAGLHE
jgi:hypothetical protein